MRIVLDGDLEKFRADVFDALEQCGFPPCPGEVTVRNPVWSKTLADFRDDFSRWLALSDEAGVMNIAIFFMTLRRWPATPICCGLPSRI